MTGVVVAVAGRLAEATQEAESVGSAPAVLIGLLAFGTLCALLFVTTRFNRDR